MGRRCVPKGTIGAVVGPNTNRQACQAVLEDLLKGKELEDREVDRIVKAKSPKKNLRPLQLAKPNWYYCTTGLFLPLKLMVISNQE